MTGTSLNTPVPEKSPGPKSAGDRWTAKNLVEFKNHDYRFGPVDGQSWTVVGSDTFSMGDSLLVGLGVSSHDPSAVAIGTFDNVAVASVPQTRRVVQTSGTVLGHYTTKLRFS